MKNISKYFFRGLIYLAPLTLTIYIIYNIIGSLNETLNIGIPGVGLLIAFVAITFLGYLGSLVISSPVVVWLEDVLIKIPLVKIIYTSIKDLVNAFAGDKGKFKTPVLVKIDFGTEAAYKPGFLTSSDLEVIGMKEFVSVYMPHSYAFSGNVLVVPSKNIVLVDVQSVDFMKFIVSGGVTHIPKKDSINTIPENSTK